MIGLLVQALGLCVLLLSLPLWIELLLLSVAAALPVERRQLRASTGYWLAVIVPAHNEEKLISACVRSLLASSQTATIVVVAHNCSDQTAALARAAGAEVLNLQGEGGKGVALDFGFQQALAQGVDGVVVIDADSVVSPNLLEAVAQALSAGSQAVQARYQVSNTEANHRTRLSGLALLGMNVLRPRGRSRLGLSCGIFGNGFALSAQTLAQVLYTANSLVEDLEYHLRLVRAGIRVDFLDQACVFGEMPEKSAAAATQRARWEGGRALMRRQWTGPLLKALLAGEFRLFEPLLDLLALPLAAETACLLFALLLPLSWMRLYAGVGLLLVAFYVMVSAVLSDDPAATLKALAAAPGYMAWKIMMIPRTRLAARKDAAWVRTRRNSEEPSE